MRVFLTGGTGFIGGTVARQLPDAGHEVVALVRDPARAGALREAGVELVRGDLSSAEVITEAARGADAAIHGAAIYKVGVLAAEAAQLRRANVDGTPRRPRCPDRRRGAAHRLRLDGRDLRNTGGEVADESHPLAEAPYGSVYEETKVAAHRVAQERIAAGAPIVIVQPSAVYGPRDHSEIGDMLRRAAKGQLPALPFGDMGVTMVHVDDVAAGIVLATERGTVGESYILSSADHVRMGDVVAQAAELGGKRAPRLTVPTGVLRLLAPAGRLIGPLAGMPPNVRELISASDGVTYWGGCDKAIRELDYRPRTLTVGLPTALD